MKNETKKQQKEEKQPLSPDVLCRLNEFIEYTGMSLNSFVDATGLDYTTVYNQTRAKKRSLSLDTVLNTLAAFSELSAEYIMRGRGEMLISKFGDSPEALKLKYAERVESLVDTIQILHDTIRTKDAVIESLKQELNAKQSV